jgi:hypothetical protein
VRRRQQVPFLVSTTAEVLGEGTIRHQHFAKVERHARKLKSQSNTRLYAALQQPGGNRLAYLKPDFQRETSHFH